MTCIFFKVFRLSARLYFLYPPGLNFCVACLNSFSLLPSKFLPFESPVTAVVAQAQLISLQKKKMMFPCFLKDKLSLKKMM